MATYCIPEIVTTMNKLGGLDSSSDSLIVTPDGIMRQMSLFEEEDSQN